LDLFPGVNFIKILRLPFCTKVQIFSTYSLALWLFVERISAQKLLKNVDEIDHRIPLSWNRLNTVIYFIFVTSWYVTVSDNVFFTWTFFKENICFSFNQNSSKEWPDFVWTTKHILDLKVDKEHRRGHSNNMFFGTYLSPHPAPRLPSPHVPYETLTIQKYLFLNTCWLWTVKWII